MHSIRYFEAEAARSTPTVLFLEPQPCVRALKYAKGLKWAFKGKIRIVFGYLYYTLSELYGHGDEVFDRLVKLDRDKLKCDIGRLVGALDPLIIHSHNAPDFLTVSAIEAAERGIPVIHDSHEALSLRKTGYYASDNEKKVLNDYPMQEKVANEKSDGRIYVTEGVRDYIQQRYNVDPSKDTVFYSYMSESLVPRRLRKRLSEEDGQIHIVYIGTVSSLIKDSHYDFRDIFKGIADRGIHVHMYVSIWGAKDKTYKRLAEDNEFIHYHGHLNQRTLLEEITQYDYGWAGFNANEKNIEHLDVALPNKAFEYIACGLPVLAFPHKTLKEFIKRNGVGLVFDDLDEMVSKLKEDRIESTRKRVLGSRHRFTVEANISKVIQHYENIYTTCCRR